MKIKQKVPDGWSVKRGKDISLLITKGASPKWQGFDYCTEGVLFVTSENVRDGFLDISSPKFLSLAFNNKQKRSSLKKGDILINIVGASIGRSCIYTGTTLANINQAVCLFRANDKTNANYLKMFLSLPTTITNLLETQTESARPNLSLNDISNLKFLLPPLPEQEKIAEVLGAWDEGIEKLSALIRLKEKQKKALMQKLLTGRIRLNGFSQPWKDVELGELLNYEQPIKYLVKDYIAYQQHLIPVLTANKAFIRGSTEDTNGIYNKEDCIIFDDFTTDTKYVDFPFKIKSSAIKILTAKKDVNLKFVFEQMFRIQYPLGGHKRNYLSEYQFIAISIPYLNEQKVIAEVLSTADDEIKLLKQKLSAFKEQKKALMQQLLTGKIRVKIN